MQNELDTILAGLRANIQQEILNHRGNDVGLVASFTTNLRHHHQRVDAKFSNLRQVGADIPAIDAASSTATEMIDQAIRSAEAAGHVEFAA